jgi:putative Mn2+ efflux pump MntP
MNIVTIILLAFALSMDALVVAVAVGVSLRKVNLRQRLRLSWHFGLFQAAMPALGWFSGKTIHLAIEQYDHWIATVLLSIVGLHMIKEFYSKQTEDLSIADQTKGLSLLFLSLSTSIDALAVGISMSMLKISIIKPALIIGLITLIVTWFGLEIGIKFSLNSRISRFAQLVGGLTLIAIGIKILYSHNVFSFN